MAVTWRKGKVRKAPTFSTDGKTRTGSNTVYGQVPTSRSSRGTGTTPLAPQGYKSSGGSGGSSSGSSGGSEATTPQEFAKQIFTAQGKQVDIKKDGVVEVSKGSRKEVINPALTRVVANVPTSATVSVPRIQGTAKVNVYRPQRKGEESKDFRSDMATSLFTAQGKQVGRTATGEFTVTSGGRTQVINRGFTSVRADIPSSARYQSSRLFQNELGTGKRYTRWDDMASRLYDDQDKKLVQLVQTHVKDNVSPVFADVEKASLFARDKTLQLESYTQKKKDKLKENISKIDPYIPIKLSKKYEKLDVATPTNIGSQMFGMISGEAKSIKEKPIRGLVYVPVGGAVFAGALKFVSSFGKVAKTQAALISAGATALFGVQAATDISKEKPGLARQQKAGSILGDLALFGAGARFAVNRVKSPVEKALVIPKKEGYGYAFLNRIKDRGQQPYKKAVSTLSEKTDGFIATTKGNNFREYIIQYGKDKPIYSFAERTVPTRFGLSTKKFFIETKIDPIKNTGKIEVRDTSLKKVFSKNFNPGKDPSWVITSPKVSQSGIVAEINKPGFLNRISTMYQTAKGVKGSKNTVEGYFDVLSRTDTTVRARIKKPRQIGEGSLVKRQPGTAKDDLISLKDLQFQYRGTLQTRGRLQRQGLLDVYVKPEYFETHEPRFRIVKERFTPIEDRFKKSDNGVEFKSEPTSVTEFKTDSEIKFIFGDNKKNILGKKPNKARSDWLKKLDSNLDKERLEIELENQIGLLNTLIDIALGKFDKKGNLREVSKPKKVPKGVKSISANRQVLDNMFRARQYLKEDLATIEIQKPKGKIADAKIGELNRVIKITEPKSRFSMEGTKINVDVIPKNEAKFGSFKGVSGVTSPVTSSRIRSNSVTSSRSRNSVTNTLANVQTSNQKSNVFSEVKQTPTPITNVIQNIKSKQQARQRQRQYQRQRTTTKQRLTLTPTNIGSPNINLRNPKPPRNPVPGLPKLGIELNGFKKISKKKKFKSDSPTKYTPSIEATLFNIRGKKRPIDVPTGLNIRPILG